MTVRRRAALLTFAVAAAFALAAGSASAAGLPSLIAMQGRGGIGTVVPGLPGTERAVAVPGSTPAWSPNGEVLAYADGQDHIVLLDRGMRRIALLPVSLGTDLTWAPDGRRLAYRCLDGPLYTPPPIPGLFAPQVSGNNICVIDVVTGAHHVLATSNSGFLVVRNRGGHLSWSPRGDEIVLTVSRAKPGCSFTIGSAVVPCGEDDIAAVNAATGAWSPVTTGVDAFSPAFSPNGHELAYITARGVVVASASGANPRTIGAFPGSVGTLAWSPDGKELVISSNRVPANNGNYDLFELSVHGGRLKQLTDTPGDETLPSWAQALTLCTVPKLKGQTLAAGKRLIQLAGCRLGVVGGPTSRRATRKIVTQSPGASHNVRLGTKVNVKLR